MKSRAPLALIEQVLMVLVFAITAAVCLRVFAYAETLSATNDYRAFAVGEVRNTAELLKAERGDAEAAAKALGTAAENGGFTLWYDEKKQPAEDGTGVLSLRVTPLESPVPGLGKANVAFLAREETLFEAEVRWQEVLK